MEKLKSFLSPKIAEDTPSDSPMDVANNELTNETSGNNKFLDIMDGKKPMVGGMNLYNYIVNPLTNRKVKLQGKLGQRILHTYLQYFKL